MIPRRLTEHVKAQNWFAVAIDFVIVVAGVFVGIQVSNLNAAHFERQREEAFLSNLRADLRRDDAEMQSQIDEAEAVIGIIDQTIARNGR